MVRDIGIDISYAMSRDAVLIEWPKFFAKENKTDLECLAVRDLSVRWQTTAVADVSVYLPRYSKLQDENYGPDTGSPMCYGLQVLSKKFTQAVWRRDWKECMMYYRMIQKEGLTQTMNYLNE